VLVNDSCRPIQDPFRDAYSVGDEVPPGEFPAATLGIVEGPGRLKRFGTSTPAGTYGNATFWDSTLGGSCGGGVQARDGTSRCLPEVRSQETALFADAGCTRRVMEERSCGTSMFAAAPITNTCAKRYLIFRLGPVIPVETLYQLGTGGCVPAGSSPRPAAIFREVGAEVDPSEFVQISPTP
jgi:hypothetical protein